MRSDFKKDVYRGERPTRACADFASDPGDLGRGVYYTSCIHFARTYGHGKARKHRVRLRNPARLDLEGLRRFYDAFDTIHGNREQRLLAATRMTEYFRERGHDGLIVRGYEAGPEHVTVVVFDTVYKFTGPS